MNEGGICLNSEFWFFLPACIGLVLVAFSIRLYCEKKKEKYLLLIALGMMAIFLSCLMFGLILRFFMGLLYLTAGCGTTYTIVILTEITAKKKMKKQERAEIFDDFVFN